MSLNTATKEQLKELIQYISDNICLPIIGVGGGDAPIGKMGMFDAIVAPQGWLIADGSEYNIEDYPELATHIASTHGSMNYYGGDGTTTFAVPDWQGEFFRASGTNGHTNQGDGANPGVHQDGTTVPYAGSWDNYLRMAKTSPSNEDSKNNISKGIGLNASEVTATGQKYTYTTRPTNTSLLCCIKATPQGHQYSEKEQIVGNWIDGKPIYEKTINFGALPNNSTKNVAHGIDNLDFVVSVNMISANNVYFLPIPYVATDNISNGRELWLDKTNISVRIAKDSSSYVKTYVTLRYTKTTD